MGVGKAMGKRAIRDSTDASESFLPDELICQRALVVGGRAKNYRTPHSAPTVRLDQQYMLLDLFMPTSYLYFAYVFHIFP